MQHPISLSVRISWKCADNETCMCSGQTHLRLSTMTVVPARTAHRTLATTVVERLETHCFDVEKGQRMLLVVQPNPHHSSEEVVEQIETCTCRSTSAEEEPSIVPSARIPPVCGFRLLCKKTRIMLKGMGTRNNRSESRHLPPLTIAAGRWLGKAALHISRQFYSAVRRD